jgi:hypothetical protein
VSVLAAALGGADQEPLWSQGTTHRVKVAPGGQHPWAGRSRYTLLLKKNVLKPDHKDFHILRPKKYKSQLEITKYAKRQATRSEKDLKQHASHSDIRTVRQIQITQ